MRLFLFLNLGVARAFCEHFGSVGLNEAPLEINDPPLGPTYIGIDGTFINAQPLTGFWRPKRQSSSPTSE